MAVVLITGTSSGIGLATALQFARSGNNNKVYATMRNPDTGAGALKAAAAAEGLKLHIAQLDVTDAGSVERAVDNILVEAGRIDVLVNNAGIGPLSVIERTTDAGAHELFETNFFGALRMIRAVLPGMREQHSGTIVNVSSVAGKVAALGSGLYAASKHALEALSESVALETRPFGIRVAIIEPGFFKTPIIDKATSAIHIDEASPYAAAEGRIAAIYGSAHSIGGEPAAVAMIIENAVTTTEPKLRYTAGIDADVFINGRFAGTDEDWLPFGDEKSDDEFWADFARRFPMPTA
jgi:NAD(P)-dependent dehydrogenase (short-subunit alcohol dehydrogenase family)